MKTQPRKNLMRGCRPAALLVAIIAALLASATSAQASTPIGAFVWPITGTTSQLGNTVINPSDTHDNGPHEGRDLSSGQGDGVTSVYPSRPGWIYSTCTGYCGGAGNHIVIDHGWGYYTRYLHLDSILVSSGYVTRTTAIGKEGNTGHSFGTHLHFEINKDGPSSFQGGHPAGDPSNYFNWDDSHNGSFPVTVYLGFPVNHNFAPLKTYDTVGVYQAWSGLWYFNNELDSSTSYSLGWGSSSWKGITGDWNADGVDTIGLQYGGSYSLVYERNPVPPTSGDYGFNLGYYWFTPVAGDWDGNGTSTPGFTASTGYSHVWYLQDANSNGPPNSGSWNHAFHFGGTNDMPVVGDFDCNGTTDVAAMEYSATDGNYWRISTNFGGLWTTWRFGSPGDLPVAGDWDGDGCDSIGVYRPSTGTWYLKNVSSTSAYVWDYQFVYGSAGDTPVTGDWDGR